MRHPRWTFGPWDVPVEELPVPPVVIGLLFDLRVVPDEYDCARGDDLRPMFSNWLTEVDEVARTRVAFSDPSAPATVFVARAIRDACPPGQNSVCVTFADIAAGGLCVPETARRVVRFLERRGMLSISKGRTATGKQGNVYSFVGVG